MRVLIYGINYRPELISTGKYSAEMADWLAENGHVVQVVTAPPYYPAWRVAEGYSGWRYAAEVVSPRLSILRCPIWLPRHVTGITRVLHLLSFALSSAPALVWLALRQRPDVILVVAPALVCAPMTWLAARLSGAKCWLHIQDFEIDAAYELGILSGRRVRNLVSRVERLLLRSFNRVSSITGKMCQHLLDKGCDPQRTCFFPNWVDIDQIRPTREPSSYRRELGLAPDLVVALYSGNMGKKQGIEDLAEVARRSSNRPDILFLFCGDGVNRPVLEAACAGLPNVRFMDIQPTERLNDLLNLADIHLLPQRKEAADLLMPCKLTGMMACGGAIVASTHRGTEVADALADRGVIVEPGSVDALAGAVRRLADDPDLRARLGRAARDHAVRHMAKREILRTFEGALWNCVNQERQQTDR